MTTQPPSRLLMFDLDGTLIDSREDLATAVNLMRADYGLAPISTPRIASFVGDGIRKLVERSMRGMRVNLDQATLDCAAHYLDHLHDKTSLYPGVTDGLRKLKAAGKQLAVITNKPSRPCREILRHFEIEPLFACILAGGDTVAMKPDPEQILTVLKKLKAAPEASWMVGDHQTDLEAARRAGVNSAFVTYGIGIQGTEKPTKTFDSFAELVESLLET